MPSITLPTKPDGLTTASLSAPVIKSTSAIGANEPDVKSRILAFTASDILLRLCRREASRDHLRNFRPADWRHTGRSPSAPWRQCKCSGCKCSRASSAGGFLASAINLTASSLNSRLNDCPAFSSGTPFFSIVYDSEYFLRCPLNWGRVSLSIICLPSFLMFVKFVNDKK